MTKKKMSKDGKKQIEETMEKLRNLIDFTDMRDFTSKEDQLLENVVVSVDDYLHNLTK